MSFVRNFFPTRMFNPCRIIKRRWFLGLIFCCSLIYFLSSVYLQSSYQRISQIQTADDKELPNIAIENIIQPQNLSVVTTCRNSVQGKAILVDDKGYVCERDSLLSNGCCDTLSEDVKRFVCDSCLPSGCCSVYEYCVSCCMEPEKQMILKKILSDASQIFRQLYSSVNDRFEFCLSKCRTSSQSVQHENSYRDANAKYCYGSNPPSVRTGDS